ncbi:MAG: aldolase catalytic domain-containing protein [Planctomycetota bacterium]|jgi:4-hydroxy 2-oxovalerate aldolase
MSEDKKGMENFAGRWVSYRPEIRIIDCTVRDGGLMNDHHFEESFVKEIYKTCVKAGIDFMEIGYKGSPEILDPKQFGPWKFCSEDNIKRIVDGVDNTSGLKLSVMADAERTDYKNDILPCSDSPLDMIRVATYIHQIPMALDMLKDANDKGYETCLNLMAISIVSERELDEALELIAGSEAQTVYVVDSFGALYGEHVQYLVKKYMAAMKASGKQIGMHAHNNQQLAFANTIDALIAGANLLDSSMAGLGRGAGNCATEQLLGFLHNPKFHLRPVLDCIQNTIEPMRKDLGWGYDIPYMLTGLRNEHPRSAMAFNDSADKGDITKFYDMLETQC